MTERPILFSGPMVRAILAGTKTQTRRLVRLPAHDWALSGIPEFLAVGPYGSRGDRLWVRETWTAAVAHAHGLDTCDCGDLNVTFAADGSTRYVTDSEVTAHERATGRDWYLPKAAQAGMNVPAMFMPRFASRLTLEVTEVRVQRLQDISEEDALAEGIAELVPPDNRGGGLTAGALAIAAAHVVSDMPRATRRSFLRSALAASLGFVALRPGSDVCASGPLSRGPSPVELYRLLWDSINAKRAPWDSNPWVWAITFRRAV